jgi:hypothetical protein
VCLLKTNYGDSPCQSDDTYNAIHDRNQNACKKIEELKETFELLDPWRTCYSVNKKFTWRQTSPIKQSRIDYFLVSEDIFSHKDLFCTTLQSPQNKKLVLANPADFCSISPNNSGLSVL